jgi:hypothetical protein
MQKLSLSYLRYCKLPLILAIISSSCAHDIHRSELIKLYVACVDFDNNLACAKYYESPITVKTCESSSIFTFEHELRECNRIAKDGITDVDQAFLENVLETCNQYVIEDCRERILKNIDLCEEGEFNLACAKTSELKEILRKTERGFNEDKIRTEEAKCGEENLESCVMAAIAHLSLGQAQGALKIISLPLRKNFGPALPILHRIAILNGDKKLARNSVDAASLAMIDECDVYGGLYCHAMIQLASDCDPEYIGCKKFQIEVGRQSQLMAQRQENRRFQKQQIAAQKRHAEAMERAAQAQEWQVLINTLNQWNKPATISPKPSTTKCRTRYDDLTRMAVTDCETH